jgi:hypothetical protein
MSAPIHTQTQHKNKSNAIASTPKKNGQKIISKIYGTFQKLPPRFFR